MDRTDSSTSPGPRWWLAVPIVAVVVAIGVAAWSASRSGGPGDDGAGTDARAATSVDGSEPAPVEVSSDAPRFRSLPELLAASDVVVSGEVVSSVEGRWFGEPAGSNGSGDTRILSRLVTIRVDDVLGGTAPSTDTVLVEEEGWTADGAPLVVDGLAAADVGDRGVWFLVEGGDPEVGAYVVVGAQGRYLELGGALVGAAGRDQLVAELSALSPEELVAEVAATSSGAADTASGG